MKLTIITHPNKILRQKNARVKKNTLELKKLIQNMIKTMYADDGIGLAAPQIGKNIQLCIIGKDAIPNSNKDLILINPSWEKISDETNTDLEGCLSIPNTYGLVKRYSHILVKAVDEDLQPIKLKAQNFMARVIQHEIDHLNGVLFIDKAEKIYNKNELNYI